MLLNYLVTALRNLRKRKIFTLINVSGLAVGMACTLLIGLFVRDEFSYDRFHRHAGQIFRVTESREAGPAPDFVGTTAPLALALKDRFRRRVSPFLWIFTKE